MISNLITDHEALLEVAFGTSTAEFDLLVPNGYDGNKQLNSYLEMNKDKFPSIYQMELAEVINRANTFRPTYKLLPGMIYNVKTFPVLENVRSYDCLSFLKRQPGNIFTNIQGLLLVLELHKKELPIDKEILSFDERNSLGEGAYDFHYLTSICCHQNDTLSLNSSYFEFKILDNRYSLLCFCEVKS